MSQKIPLSLIAACLAALSASVFADTVTLRDGTKIEGKVTSETDTEVVIDEKVSATITDPRTFKKADVLSVTKEAADEVAWQPLKNFKPGVNSLPATSYDTVLGALNGFVAQFPKSLRAAEAQKIADAFTAEKKRVDDGEVKLDDKWLSKDEVQKERYQINALLAFNYMKQQDAIGALNTFAAIEKNYPGARVMPDAVDHAKTLLAALKAEVARRTPALAALKTEREAGIKAATDTQKAEIVAAIKREQDAAAAALAMADKQGLKWPPLIATSEKSLQVIGSKVASEAGRIEGLPVAKMRESIAASDKARTAFASKDFAAAETALRTATAAWSQNEVATRLLADVSTAKTAAAAATPAPIAAAATPAPSRAADTGDVATAVEKPKPFLLTPAGAITVVIVVAFLIAAMNAFKKIKGKANDILE